MKLLFKLGRNTTKMFEQLRQVYGEEVMSRPQVFERCKRFSDGRDEVKFDSRPGCPATSKSDENVGKVRIKLSLIADLEV